MEPLLFKPFIPGTRRKPGNAGLSAKELRDRKKKRLEREQVVVRHHATTQVTPPSLPENDGDDERERNSTTTKRNDILVSPCVQESSSERNTKQQQTEHTDETLIRPQSPLEPQNSLQKLPAEASKEQEEIRQSRYQIQKQIQKMQDRRTELSNALEHERVELQRDEQTYAELETDLAGFQETIHLIQARRNEVEKGTQTKRAELMQLQAMVEEMRTQVAESQQIQRDCRQEIEHRTRELERERSTFANAMQKANSNIARLRETVEKLKECQRAEAEARAATLAAAKQAVSTGKLKVSLLLSDNSQNRPSTSEVKTVYWKPNDKKKRRAKESTLQLDAVRPEEAMHSESDDRGESTSHSMEVHATPVKHRRRHVDLQSQVDSLSRLGEAVNEPKSSSAEKKKEYGSLRKQLMNDWKTDSLAVSSHDKGVRNSSPPSLTYMGHEILRKRRRSS